MTVYSYTALNRNGTKKQGTLCARDPDNLRQLVADMDAEILNWKIINPSRWSRLTGERNIQTLRLEILQGLAHMLNHHITIDQAIDMLRHTIPNIWARSILDDIYTRMINGMSFSMAAEHHPVLFDRLFIMLVNAGEKTGALPTTLGYLKDYTAWMVSWQTKMRSSLRYPMIVGSTFMIALMLYIYVVIPNIQTFFDHAGIHHQAMPIMFKFAHAIGDLGGWIAIPIVFLICLIMLGRHRLKYWLFGSLYTTIRREYIARIMQLTLDGGLSLVQSISCAFENNHNKEIQTSYDDMMRSLKDGVPLWQALEKSGYFDDIAIYAIRMGEKTNTLPTMFSMLANHYSDMAQKKLDAVKQSMGPLLLIAVGILYILVFWSCLDPIYQSYGLIHD